MGKKVDDDDRSLEGWANIILRKPSTLPDSNNLQTSHKLVAGDRYSNALEKITGLPLVRAIPLMLQEELSPHLIMTTLMQVGFTEREIFGALRKQDEHFMPVSDEVVSLIGSVPKHTWFLERLTDITK